MDIRVKNQIVEPSNFVKPSPKPELDGELGLYAWEIAKSLGVSAKNVRQKLNARGFMKTLKDNNLAAVAFATPNDTNGLHYQEYCLEVAAAKFLVARWNNELGSAYLTFLLKLEEKVNELDQLAKEDPITANMLHTLKIRQEQLRQGKQLRQVESRLNDFEANQSGMVAEKVEEALQEKSAFPEDCIRSEEIGPKYFPGVAQRKVVTYLNAIKHPKGHYVHNSEQGSVVVKPFKAEGLAKAARRFFLERELFKETPKLLHWYHPSVGVMHEQKGLAS